MKKIVKLMFVISLMIVLIQSYADATSEINSIEYSESSVILSSGKST